MTQSLAVGSSCTTTQGINRVNPGLFFLTGKEEALFFFIRVAERVRFVGLEHRVAILPPGRKNLPVNKINTEERKAERWGEDII